MTEPKRRGRTSVTALSASRAATSVGVAVLSFDASLSDDMIRAVVTDAAIAGRTAVIDGTNDAMRGAIDSARHSATLRGEEALVVDAVRGLVGFRRGDEPIRVRRLVVVRYLGVF